MIIQKEKPASKMYQLHPKVMEELNRITSIRLEELTPEETAFLRARQSYLTPTQFETYKHLFEKPAKKGTTTTKAEKPEVVEDQKPQEEAK